MTTGPYRSVQLPQPVTVYGLIPALQNASRGGPCTDSNTDTVTF